MNTVENNVNYVTTTMLTICHQPHPLSLVPYLYIQFTEKEEMIMHEEEQTLLVLLNNCRIRED